MLFARRASPCSPLPTLPRAASAVLASSPGDGCCFRIFYQNNCSDPKCLFVRINTCQSDISHLRNRVVKQGAFTHCASHGEGTIPGVLFFNFRCAVFFTSFLVWQRVWFHNPLPLGPDTYYVYCVRMYAYLACLHAYRVLLPPLLLLCVAILLLLLQLLLFLIVYRMVKFVAGTLILIPAFSFSSCKHDLFSMHDPLVVLLSPLRPRYACV